MVPCTVVAPPYQHSVSSWLPGVATGPPVTAVAALHGPPQPVVLVSTSHVLPTSSNSAAPLAGTAAPPAVKAAADVTRTSELPPLVFSFSATVTSVASVHPLGSAPTLVLPPALNVP